MEPLGTEWRRQNSTVRRQCSIAAVFQFKFSDDGARSRFRVDVPSSSAQAWRDGNYIAPFSKHSRSVEEAS